MYKLLILIALVLIMTAGPAWAGKFEDGLALYSDGKFKQAAEVWTPVAKKGDASAQYYLGQMYYKGKGVTKDLTQAYAWLSLAARNGMDLAVELMDDVAEDMNEADLVKARKMVGALGG